MLPKWVLDMLPNGFVRLLFIFIIISCLFINLSVSTLFTLKDNWERVSDINEEYHNGTDWTTYSIKPPSISKIEITEEGEFNFAYKSMSNRFYFNNKLFEGTSRFNESNYIHVNKNDILKWVAVPTNSNDGQVLIAFRTDQISHRVAPPEVPKTSSVENKMPSIISLIPDKSSPQEEGNVIDWTAKAQDEDNDILFYKFFIDDLNKTDWRKENKWMWNTTGYLGNCKIEVQLRDKNHADPDRFDDSYKTSFVINPKREQLRNVSGLKFWPDKPSPQNSGTYITWTAEALDSNTKSLTYKFLINGSDMTNWISENRWTWDTKGKTGCWNVEVRVRNEAGFESNNSSKFILDQCNQFYVNKYAFDISKNIYPSIQLAIDNIPDYGIISVTSGLYNECIVIRKPLSLIGENLSSVISQSDDEVVHISSCNVTIRGFTINGGDVGISSSNGMNNSIIDNYIQNSQSEGIESEEPENLLIEGNVLSKCGGGIKIVRGINSVLDSNEISDSTDDALDLEDSRDMKIKNNKIFNGSIGIYLYKSNNNYIVNNTLDTTLDTMIAISNSCDNRIFENNLSNSMYGIYMGDNSFRNVLGGNNTYAHITSCKLECSLPTANCGNNTIPSDIRRC